MRHELRLLGAIAVITSMNNNSTLSRRDGKGLNKYGTMKGAKRNSVSEHIQQTRIELAKEKRERKNKKRLENIHEFHDYRNVAVTREGL